MKKGLEYLRPRLNTSFKARSAKWGGKSAGEFTGRILDATRGFPPEGNDDETFLAVAAYILQANGAAPGSQELTTTTAIPVDAAVGRTGKLTKS